MKKNRSVFERLLRSFVYLMVRYYRWKSDPKNAVTAYRMRVGSFESGPFTLF